MNNYIFSVAMVIKKKYRIFGINSESFLSNFICIFTFINYIEKLASSVVRWKCFCSQDKMLKVIKYWNILFRKSASSCQPWLFNGQLKFLCFCTETLVFAFGDKLRQDLPNVHSFMECQVAHKIWLWLWKDVYVHGLSEMLYILYECYKLRLLM